MLAWQAPEGVSGSGGTERTRGRGPTICIDPHFSRAAASPHEPLIVGGAPFLAVVNAHPLGFVPHHAFVVPFLAASAASINLRTALYVALRL